MSDIEALSQESSHAEHNHSPPIAPPQSLIHAKLEVSIYSYSAHSSRDHHDLILKCILYVILQTSQVKDFVWDLRARKDIEKWLETANDSNTYLNIHAATTLQFMDIVVQCIRKSIGDTDDAETTADFKELLFLPIETTGAESASFLGAVNSYKHRLHF